MPTKAECAGMAFAEARAYGIPSFTFNTGGVLNYVINGLNGYTLPLGSFEEEFEKIIKEVIYSGEIEKLSIGARKRYTEVNNWNTWKERVKNEIEILLKKK